MDKIREMFKERCDDMPMDGVYWSDGLGYYTTSDQSLLGYMDFCNDLFEAFKSGYQAAKASQWISVEDRLPEHGNLVVAAHLYEYGTEPDCAVCCFYDGVFLPHTDGLEANNYDGGAVITLDMDVTHWMPLPEGQTK